MNYKKFDLYIVVNAANTKPMSFVEKYKQFFYCDTELYSRPHAIQLYTKKEALRLMEISRQTKIKKGLSCCEFFLMPVNNLAI